MFNDFIIMGCEGEQDAWIMGSGTLFFSSENKVCPEGQVTHRLRWITKTISKASINIFALNVIPRMLSGEDLGRQKTEAEYKDFPVRNVIKHLLLTMDFLEWEMNLKK